MQQPIPPSELITNADGSIYHLNLRPEDVGDWIITVGDQNRVARVSQHFDRIDVQKAKREFVTHTGWLGSKRITVISTGIGPDNIDIVLNELDALVNIDMATRLPVAAPRSLPIIRIGTTGGLQADIPVDGVICSAMALGFDNVMGYYDWTPDARERQLAADWAAFTAEGQWQVPVAPYAVDASAVLLAGIAAPFHQGITLTAPGFYGPQGRQLRAKSLLQSGLFDALHRFESQGHRMTNLEMETSAIYGLSRVLGHRALSCSVVLANRHDNTFSPNPGAAVDQLIVKILTQISGYAL